MGGDFKSALAHAGLYIVASIAQVVLVKALNYKADVWLALYCAILFNQMWIIRMPSYLMERYRYHQRKQRLYSESEANIEEDPEVSEIAEEEREVTTRYLLGVYTVMALCTCMTTTLRSYAVNLMPGSVNPLLFGTSIIFEMVFSRIILKREFTVFHGAAAACCVAAAFSVGLASLLGPASDEIQGKDFAFGIPAAIGGAAALGLSSTLTNQLTRDWSNKSLRGKERAVFSGIVASLLQVGLLFLLQEWREWPLQLGAASQDKYKRRWLIAMSCCMPVAEATARSQKRSAIGNRSGFFFQVAHSAGMILGSLVSILVFQEDWNWGLGAGFPLIILGIAFYGAAYRYQKHQEAERDKANGLPLAGRLSSDSI